jgi:hypothetical protein
MPIILMLSWWYSRGWLANLEWIKHNLQAINRTFAIGVLLRTWFAPWKQVYVQSTFATFFKDLVDNTVSRLIGGVIRTCILLFALLLALGAISIGLTLFIIWPVVPFLLIIFPVMAVRGNS